MIKRKKIVQEYLDRLGFQLDELHDDFTNTKFLIYAGHLAGILAATMQREIRGENEARPFIGDGRNYS